jgi:hypothetical protein
MNDNKQFLILSLMLATIVLVVLGVALGELFSVYINRPEISPNEQTLNAYAAFESTCSYRGYDRDECLLIWSGR